MRSFGFCLTPRPLLIGGFLAIGAAWSPSAGAQSAADKATARQLATQGIGDFRRGEYDIALDRLGRAQVLYPAPIHLLYIARTQRELGRWVESSETYRRVVRSQLAPGAPDAFREAAASAREELALLQPKIPSLTIDVEPDGLKELTLTIDGRPVAAAVEGVARPIDPGLHRIGAKADGYREAIGEVELADAQRGMLTLKLEPAPPVAGSPAVASKASASPATSPTGEANPAQDSPGKGPETADERGAVVPYLGASLLLAVPMGNLYRTQDAAGDERVAASSKRFRGGGGLELQLGATFRDFFSAGLFLDWVAYAPGATYDGFIDPAVTVDYEYTPSSIAVGLEFLVGTPRGQLGGFGEFGIAYERMQVTGDASTSVAGAQACSLTDALSGPSVRVGGGARVAPLRWLELVPAAAISVGRFNQRTVSTCGEGLPGVAFPDGGSIASDEQETHATLMFFLGSDILFGTSPFGLR